MAIEGVGKVNAPAAPKVGSKSSAKSGDFSRLIEGESSSAASVNDAQPVNSIDALLALQEVDDVTERRSKARRRAHQLLDELDTLRHGLLMGEISPHQLHLLRDRIAVKRESVDDEKLSALLDEIDLRVEVELAKLEAAGGQI